MFTLLVKDLYSSYKDLPVWLYQIQTKYRDEQRPRAGILRAREFVMKDSYSFDVSDEAFLASYAAHRQAYINVFDRLGLDYVIVAAMSGAMGGSASEEFLATAENGEDTYVRCTACDYAANVEAVRVPGARTGSLRGLAARARRGDARHAHHRDSRRSPQRRLPSRRPTVVGEGHPEERGGDPRAAGWVTRTARHRCPR
jgi:prolyl-tRNA synthetase